MGRSCSGRSIEGGTGTGLDSILFTQADSEGGTDDRFLSSVGMGLRPAKFHEKWWTRQGGAGASGTAIRRVVFRPCQQASLLLLRQVTGGAQLVQWHLSEILVGEASGFGPSLRRHLSPKFTELGRLWHRLPPRSRQGSCRKADLPAVRFSRTSGHRQSCLRQVAEAPRGEGRKCRAPGRGAPVAWVPPCQIFVHQAGYLSARLEIRLGSGRVAKRLGGGVRSAVALG